MPTPVINSFAEKSGKSKDEVERLYNKAKDIVKQEYEDVEVDSDQYYQLVIGILKKMLGIEEEAVNTLSTVGGKADGKSSQDAYKYKIPIGSTLKDIEKAFKKIRKDECTSLLDEISFVMEEDTEV